MIYQPREDSFLLEKSVSKYSNGKKVLDMGAGSGIIGFACINAGASAVTFADINALAVNSIKKKGYDAVNTDLFLNINSSFDLIVFNPPYLPEDDRENKESALATTGGKEGDEIVCRFIDQAPAYLNKGGKILLLLSSLTPRARFDAICKGKNLKKKVIARQKFDFEQLEVLLIKANSFKPQKAK